ncbi:hypothetical protein DFH29DRAFT_856818 [Suillus ampliporus]|nr:hypothetical protein DFH29DRAFT_856818 [Suillus ampliporus]
MAPTRSLSPGPRRRALSAYDLQRRRDGKRDRWRHHRQAARDEADATGSYERQYHKGKGYTAGQNEEERRRDHKRHPGVYTQQDAESMEGPNQVSELFDPTLDFLKSLTEGTTVNPLHQQQPVISPVQPSSVLGSDAASQQTQVSLSKLHPSLPPRPVIVEPPSRSRSPAKASSLLAKPRPTLDNEAISQLTRDLWDTRREMTALQARETDLVASLSRLNAPLHILETGQAKKPTSGDYFLASFKLLAQVESELQQERNKRIQAERGLSEIERESRAPFVVPALLRAFLNLSEMVV